MDKDNDKVEGMGEEWRARLRERAEKAIEKASSSIAAGSPGEVPLEMWKAPDCGILRLPDDEQGILRISAGGISGKHYLSFRGDPKDCLEVLQRVTVLMHGIVAPPRTYSAAPRPGEEVSTHPSPIQHDDDERDGAEESGPGKLKF